MPTKLEKNTYYSIQEAAKCIGRSYNTTLARIEEAGITPEVIVNIKIITHDDLLKLVSCEKLPASIVGLRLGLNLSDSEENLQDLEN